VFCFYFSLQDIAANAKDLQLLVFFSQGRKVAEGWSIFFEILTFILDWLLCAH
jgi:hypothetical protein